MINMNDNIQLGPNTSVVVIIPARGGSKGIPRKNIRHLAGEPLLSYSIKSALESAYEPDVYVTTDDAEIEQIALKCGAQVVRRESALGADNVTLDPVIFHAYEKICAMNDCRYKIIVTLQPTSPLLKTSSIDAAISSVLDCSEPITIISAKKETHLYWRKSGGDYLPNFVKRVNRQQLPPVYKETGGFLITTEANISQHNRIGDRVDLHILDDDEAIDIDDFVDWAACEYYLRRKNLVFVVSGNQTIGLGHVYNTLALANDIIDHEIKFLVDQSSELAFEKINEYNFHVQMQKQEDILDDIITLSPDVVINDVLDTDAIYIEKLKERGIKVVNFEDLGSGASKADLVFNAIYPERECEDGHFFGPDFFLLRDEFLRCDRHTVKENVEQVLITFGGTDPNNYTLRVVECIYDYCHSNNIKIRVVAGFGYKNSADLKKFDGIEIISNTSNISLLMASADIIFTSAGRTTYEVASLNVPTVVLAQNDRELSHLFASAEHGFTNLGLGFKVEDDLILSTFKKYAETKSVRIEASNLMKKADLKGGRTKVKNLIYDLINRD